ncbi:Hypothetical protein MSYG_0012 [Malassezia sympodialis ATCC 42132]|uniref:Uncharacterized protein n=1 Tax=Malassezia sympodialis (strain ATCC 42132) TaxID=1230383 RepID=A0A1M7ZZS0_MALS4|nr:Hypothetical protein MSYG_0012 [Malassezia sympodialis ATCC 42132]
MLHVVLELINTVVILLHVHRAMVALPTPRGASPAVWGQSHAAGPKGRVRRVGSQRRRTAVADALRLVAIWSTYLALRPLIDRVLVWIVPFCRTFQLVWLVWLLLNPAMASRATFSLVRPWVRRNEPWIDEACLWAQGIYLVTLHMARQVTQRWPGTWSRRPSHTLADELEVETSLPVDRDRPTVPGAMVTPHATPLRPPRESAAIVSSEHTPAPAAMPPARPATCEASAPVVPQPETLKASPPGTHAHTRPRRDTGRKALPHQQDTQNSPPIPASIASGSPSAKRKRASQDESIALAHIEARIQAQGEPAAKVRRRTPTSAARASNRRVPSQTSLLPRPRRETPRASQSSRSTIQTRAQRARTAARSS